MTRSNNPSIMQVMGLVLTYCFAAWVFAHALLGLPL